jgi:hypothetical protein
MKQAKNFVHVCMTCCSYAAKQAILNTAEDFNGQAIELNKTADYQTNTVTLFNTVSEVSVNSFSLLLKLFS